MLFAAASSISARSSSSPAVNRRGRRSGEAGTTAAATRATAPPTTASSQRSSPSPVGGTRVVTIEACTPAWVTSIGPASSSTASDIATRDDQGYLPGSRPGDPDEHVADRHAERHPGHDLTDPPQPGRIGDAECDHRDDRREERPHVTQEHRRHPPGGRGSHGALRDLPPVEAPLPPASAAEAPSPVGNGMTPYGHAFTSMRHSRPERLSGGPLPGRPLAHHPGQGLDQEAPACPRATEAGFTPLLCGRGRVARS